MDGSPLRYLCVNRNVGLRRRWMNCSLANVRIGLAVGVLAATGLFFRSSDLVGQSTGADPATSSPSAKNETKPTALPGGVEILTDTDGVDFGPYVRKALGIIKKNWIPLIPEEARPPAKMQGETLIRFSILPDGKISGMHLDGSSQHSNIDRTAWGAITAVGQFPPLPTEFKGSHLELRINFLTNRPLPVSPPPVLP
jgi:TonB family protein